MFIDELESGLIVTKSLNPEQGDVLIKITRDNQHELRFTSDRIIMGFDRIHI